MILSSSPGGSNPKYPPPNREALTRPTLPIAAKAGAAKDEPMLSVSV
jgi:hypothetical protein